MLEAETIDSGSGQTLERILAASGLAAVVVGSAAVWYFDPTKAGLFPVCPLYSLTGIACPGCGLTRGFHALFHGDIATALGYNALLPVFGLIIGYLFISGLYFVLRGRGLKSLTLSSTSWMYGLMALVILFGVIRNIPAYPFTLLYP